MQQLMNTQICAYSNILTCTTGMYFWEKNKNRKNKKKRRKKLFSFGVDGDIEKCNMKYANDMSVANLLAIPQFFPIACANVSTAIENP